MIERGSKGPEQLHEQKSMLARTLADYRGIEVSAPEPLKENPDKTLAQTMSDEALHTYLQEAVDALTLLQESVESGGKGDHPRLERNIKEYLAPDIAYLRSIGRLPPEFDFDPYRRFGLKAPRRRK